MVVLIFLFIIGICIGSFLNVLADRLPDDKSPWKGRSHCDHCKKTLKWYDMVPLLSFTLLRGKCRYCRTSLTFYYPLVEATTGIMFVVVYIFISESRIVNHELWFSNFEFINYLGFRVLSLGFIIDLFFYLFIVCFLIVIFFADLKYGIIPDAVLYPAILATIIYHLSFSIFHFQAIGSQLSIINYLLSGLFAFLLFFFLFLVTKGRGMGFGDVKYSFFIGFLLGFPGVIFALYIAFLTGAVVGIILIIWGKKKLSKSTIPFGPFLVLGTLSALFFGQQVSHWLYPALFF